MAPPVVSLHALMCASCTQGAVVKPDGVPAGGAGGGEGGEEGGEGPKDPREQEDPVQAMMKDQFGNYVVQKVLEVCDDAQRDVLMARVRAQLHNLKRFTYGKHIVARVEKLLSAGTKIQTHLRARPLPDDTQPLASIAPSSRPTSNGPSRTGSFSSRDNFALGALGTRAAVTGASPLGAPGSNSSVASAPHTPGNSITMPAVLAAGSDHVEVLPSTF